MTFFVWGFLGLVAAISAGRLIVRLSPPKVTAMSEEWLSHTRYQVTKDGGPRSFYNAK